VSSDLIFLTGSTGYLGGYVLIELIERTTADIACLVRAPDDTAASRGQLLLMICGSYNLILMVFNLMPIPPLDGSHILANFHAGYARLLGDPSKQGIFLFAFFFAFMLAGVIFTPALRAGVWYVGVVAG